MRLLLSAIVVIVCTGLLLASEPGEPLGCSDWVFLEPGLSCSTEIAFPCEDATGFLTWCTGNSGIEADNVGGQIAVRVVPLQGVIDCDFGPIQNAYRAELVRFDGVAEHVLGYVDGRCGPPASGTVDTLRGPSGMWQLVFDEEGGGLQVVMLPDCSGLAAPFDCQYGEGRTLIRIDGFTTTFEVLQTYQPTTNEISFRVPYICPHH